jgi:uracil-DNA glycosylase family 4
MRSLAVLNQHIITCTACPRLVTYRQAVAQEKRRQYREWIYWGRPVPGFGDPAARLYVLGLAPAAHGGNRTGRIFTGDRSGDWLYEALHHFGFANQATSTHRDDGLALSDCYIGATVRCAPPDNKPMPEEFERCRPFIREELRLLQKMRVVVVLGKIAFDHYLKARGGAHASFAPSHVRSWNGLPPSVARHAGRLLSSESTKYLHRETDEADVPRGIHAGEKRHRAGLTTSLLLVLRVPIREKLLQAHIGQRMLHHLLEDCKWHRANMPAG